MPAVLDAAQRPPDQARGRLGVRGLTKRFGAQVALDEVTLEIEPGTIHAVAGENGAGKSTLIKIVTGVHQPDAGEVLVAGEPVALPSPREARDSGIGWAHQHVDAVPTITVRENLFLTIGYPTRLGKIDWGEVDRLAREQLERVGLDVHPKTRLGELSPAAQHLVALARLLLQDPAILILDEPTATLGEADSENLLRLIEEQREAGRTIVFVTHRLDEILRVADAITVLRDGRHVATLPAAEVTRPRLVELLGGSTEQIEKVRPRISTGVPRLAVSELAAIESERSASFELGQGEVVGLAGLVGSGRSTLAKMLAGMTAPAAGTVAVDGSELRLRRYADALAHGIVLVPEDRGAALVPDFGIAENISLGDVARHARGGVVLRLREEKASAAELSERLRIKGSGAYGVRYLSGGNQQKVLLARALSLHPRVLILDEPTGGIDIATKEYIHGLVRELAGEGMSILYISSDLEELPLVSDRILVYRKGRVTAELPGDASRSTIVARLFDEE
jgi:ABC-type sugar transport system ATPase subunit